MQSLDLDGFEGSQPEKEDEDENSVLVQVAEEPRLGQGQVALEEGIVVPEPAGEVALTLDESRSADVEIAANQKQSSLPEAGNQVAKEQDVPAPSLEQGLETAAHAQDASLSIQHTAISAIVDAADSREESDSAAFTVDFGEMEYREGFGGVDQPMSLHEEAEDRQEPGIEVNGGGDADDPMPTEHDIAAGHQEKETIALPQQPDPAPAQFDYGYLEYREDFGDFQHMWMDEPEQPIASGSGQSSMTRGDTSVVAKLEQDFVMPDSFESAENIGEGSTTREAGAQSRYQRPQFLDCVEVDPFSGDPNEWLPIIPIEKVCWNFRSRTGAS